MDRSGEQCQIIPEKVPKDSSWKDTIYNGCVDWASLEVKPDFEVNIKKYKQILSKVNARSIFFRVGKY